MWNIIFLTSEDKLIDTGKINEITGKPIYEKVPGEKLKSPAYSKGQLQ